jgi:hypothetical protein
MTPTGASDAEVEVAARRRGPGPSLRSVAEVPAREEGKEAERHRAPAAVSAQPVIEEPYFPAEQGCR